MAVRRGIRSPLLHIATARRGIRSPLLRIVAARRPIVSLVLGMWLIVARHCVVTGCVIRPGIVCRCCRVIIEAGHGFAFQRLADQALDSAHHSCIVTGYQRECVPGARRTPGAPDAMGVCLGGLGHIVVDTCEICATSIPRAAISVATRI